MTSPRISGSLGSELRIAEFPFVPETLWVWLRVWRVTCVSRDGKGPAAPRGESQPSRTGPCLWLGPQAWCPPDTLQQHGKQTLGRASGFRPTCGPAHAYSRVSSPRRLSSPIGGPSTGRGSALHVWVTSPSGLPSAQVQNAKNGDSAVGGGVAEW